MKRSLKTATFEILLGSKKRKQYCTMSKVSIIFACSNMGEILFTANRGNNNGKTVLLFMLKLIEFLDSRDAQWRSNTILLLDNAAYHRGIEFTKVM